MNIYVEDEGSFFIESFEFIEFEKGWDGRFSGFWMENNQVQIVAFKDLRGSRLNLRIELILLLLETDWEGCKWIEYPTDLA